MIQSFQSVTVTTAEPRTCKGCLTRLPKGSNALASFQRTASGTK